MNLVFFRRHFETAVRVLSGSTGTVGWKTNPRKKKKETLGSYTPLGIPARPRNNIIIYAWFRSAAVAVAEGIDRIRSRDSFHALQTMCVCVCDDESIMCLFLFILPVELTGGGGRKKGKNKKRS